MSATHETRMQVDGMSCSSCVRHIDRALLALAGVAKVEVRLRERQVVVQHGDQTDAAQLLEAIRGAGYQARAA